MRRREWMRSVASGAAAGALAASLRGDVPDHLWQGYDFGPGPAVPDSLNQSPFGVEQDEGWFTIAATTPSHDPVRNFGYGLVGYTWEESGPSLAARRGAETLEQHVENMATLPFVDVLYIRCDWRDVQSRPGRLDLRLASFVLPKGLERRMLRLRAGIETKAGVRRPVRWSCAQQLDADGACPIEVKQHGDPDWRKGV